MQGSSNRSIVVISGLMTLLILGGATLAVAFHHGWLRTPSDAPTPDAVSVRAQTTDNRSARPSATLNEGPAREEAVVYQQKLDEAYRALDEAYAQIRVLQTPQTRLASGGDRDERFAERDGDDDHRERRSHRRDSDDE